MPEITIKDTDGNTVANGIMGESVVEMEGNYYFDRDKVQIDNMAKKEDAYTCPIKKSTCDYYYMKDSEGNPQGREVAWIYDEITNTSFKGIEGKVGFYKQPEGLTVEIS